MKTRAIHSGKKRRAGFSLVEVIVALGMLSLMLMGLARVTFQMAQASRTNGNIAKRTAVMIQESNKFNSIPFSTLNGYNGTSVDLKFGDLTFQRRVVVTPTTTSSTTNYTVKVVITPYVGGVLTTALKDSFFVFRTNPPGSPLCTTCLPP
jgi:prepilin-type N-terminal cleavage/methylation domain-containing protein